MSRVSRLSERRWVVSCELGVSSRGERGIVSCRAAAVHWSRGLSLKTCDGIDFAAMSRSSSSKHWGRVSVMRHLAAVAVAVGVSAESTGLARMVCRL